MVDRLLAPAVITLGVVVAIDWRIGGAALLAVGVLAVVTVAVRRFDLFVFLALASRAGIDRLGVAWPVTASEGAALLLLAAGALWWWRAGRPLPRSPLVAPFGVFLAACAASVLASSEPLVSLRELGRLVVVALMLVLLDALLRRGVSPALVVGAVFVSSLVPLGVALGEAIGGEGRRIAGFARVDGTFSHPNPFAIYLALLLVAGVALLPHLAPRLRPPLTALLVVVAGCLVVTYTRGAWIAAVLGLVVVGVLQSKRLLIGMAVAAVVLVAAVPSVGARFGDLDRERRESGAAGNSLVWRLEHWGEAIDDVTANPVSGIGLKMVQERSEGEKNVHNDFIRVAVETGIVGLAAFVWLLVRLTGVANRALQRTRDGDGVARGVAVAFAGGLVVLLVSSASANVITQVVLLWYFVALAAVATRVGDREALAAASTP